MNNFETTEHIEEDSFKIFAMDEKTEILPREKKEIFHKHLALCPECRSKFEEAKLEISLLERVRAGENIPLPPEFSYLQEKDFAHQIFLRFKKETEFENQEKRSKPEPTVLSLRLWFAMASIVFLLVAAGFLIYRNSLSPSPTSSGDIAKFPTIAPTPPINQNIADENVRVNVPSDNSVVAVNTSPNYTNRFDSQNKNTSAEANREDQNESEIKDGNLLVKGGSVTGANYYNIDLTYQDLVSGEAFKPQNPIPAISDATLSGDKTKIKAVSPNGVAVRTTTPTLTWKTSQKAGGFQIEVYDDAPEFRNTPILKTSVEAGTSWTVSQNLRRGRYYTWQIKSLNNYSGQTAEGRFRVISDEELETLNEVEKISPRSNLILAHFFAKMGLLDEAMAQLLQLKTKNPQSQLARELIIKLKKQFNTSK